MTAETIARKWHDQFLRTDAIDHSQAQAAVQHAYRSAGLPPPERFLWAASPLEAAWAVLVLVGRTDGYNHAVLDDIERRKTGKAKVAEARAPVAARFGSSDDEVEGYFGKPFYMAEGSSPLAKQLTKESTEAWMARANAGDDFLAVHKRGPFKPLHDLEQVLYFEGYRGGKGSLYNQALTAVDGQPIAILAGRSAHHRLYGSFAFIAVALDEALAEAGKFEPTALQRAMWAAYEACGMWWPCHDGVVFAERPVAAELTSEAPRMEWADGFTLGGKPAAKPAAPAPTTTPAPPPNQASVLDAELPRDHDQRMALLRNASVTLPHLDRYLAGEHEQVWKDLVALGDKVRTDEHAADALAVAYETMHRVARNVRTIARRLQALNYRFVYPGTQDSLFGLGEAKAHEPNVPPTGDVFETIIALERAIAGPLPTSLRAVFEAVGEVNFNGDHPSLAPQDSNVAPDPLMICSVKEALAMIESDDREDCNQLLLEFAPDALHKANVSGGEPYSIVVPTAAADAPVQDEPHRVFFVEYLRIAILQWGGFPGWEQAPADLPPELEELRRDLIAF